MPQPKWESEFDEQLTLRVRGKNDSTKIYLAEPIPVIKSFIRTKLKDMIKDADEMSLDSGGSDLAVKIKSKWLGKDN